MGDVFTKLRTIIGGIVRIGLGGPQLKRSGGALEVRNVGDTDYAPVRAGWPSTDDDVATKAYVDAGTIVKAPVVAATTGNVDLSTGGLLTIDGVATSAGDRVLVWQQTTGSQNGIYTAAAGAWSRAPGFENASTDLIEAGNKVYVQRGNSYGRVEFTLITTGTIIVGTTNLEFIPMNGLARTDAISTEVIATTAFSTGYNWSSEIDMRDYTDLSVYFNPTALGTNTAAWIAIQWSDDGSTIPFGDDNFQLSDVDITQQTDGTFQPLPYVAHLTVAGGELAANARKLLTFPKAGGKCRIGVKGTAADGSYSVRAQRLVR